VHSHSLFSGIHGCRSFALTQVSLCPLASAVHSLSLYPTTFVFVSFFSSAKRPLLNTMRLGLISTGGLARILLVSLLGTWMAAAPARAAMSASDIQLACNSLAHMAFDLKDLVNVVATMRNPGPFQVGLCSCATPSVARHPTVWCLCGDQQELRTDLQAGKQAGTG
jgi:hypothetical protein